MNKKREYKDGNWGATLKSLAVKARKKERTNIVVCMFKVLFVLF